MKQSFEITKNCVIKKCSTSMQNCVYCGRNMTPGLYAISMNNAGDRLMLKKNLWMHLRCGPELGKKIEEALDKHGLKIAALQI